MNIMKLLRSYHAVLALFTFAAFVTGEMGLIHAWLGYGLGCIMLLRLISVLTGYPQLGLMRFYPQFEGLKLGNALTHPAISKSLLLAIAAMLFLTVTSGIIIDGGKSIGFAQSGALVTQAYASEHEHESGQKEEGLIGEAHEMFANLLMLLVVLHVAYVFTCKRPLAKFMLFQNTTKQDK